MKRLEAKTFPRIAVNAGALNPRQLATNVPNFLVQAFGEKGKELMVAYVTGDNLLGLSKSREWLLMPSI